MLRVKLRTGNDKALLQRLSFMFSLLATTILLGLLAGCSAWRNNVDDHPAIGKAPPGSILHSAQHDHLVMAVIIMEYRDQEIDLVEQIWNESDRQAIDIDTRRVLDTNGMRASVVASHLSGSMGRLLDRELPMVIDAMPGLVEAFDDKSLPARSRLNGVRMNVRPGVMREVPISGVFANVQWEMVTGDRTTPGVATNSQACFQITATPRNDTAASIHLVPVFRDQVGQPMFQAGKADFELSSRQEFQPLNAMAIDTKLRPGQTLIVGPNHQFSDDRPADSMLGSIFFGDDREQGYTGLRRIIMVRLINLPTR